MEWRPIETAPEDEFVLVWCPDYNGEDRHVIAIWGCVTGWWPKYCGPTHWMPLPEPPEEKEDE